MKIITLKKKRFIYINIKNKLIDINISINYSNNIINRNYSSVPNPYNTLYVSNSIPIINPITIINTIIVILLINNITLNRRKIVYFN